MAAIALCATLLIVTSQSALQVGPRDLTADPARYHGKIVEVRGRFWVLAESTHLCSDRLNPADHCEGVMPDRGSGPSDKDWARVIKAGALAESGKAVWLTVRGRFEAADSPQWGGVFGSYRFRILIEEVLKVETKNGDGKERRAGS